MGDSLGDWTLERHPEVSEEQASRVIHVTAVRRLRCPASKRSWAGTLGMYECTPEWLRDEPLYGTP